MRAYLHGFSDFSVPEVVFSADDLHIVNVYIVFVFDCVLSNRCKGGAGVSGSVFIKSDRHSSGGLPNIRILTIRAIDFVHHSTFVTVWRFVFRVY